MTSINYGALTDPGRVRTSNEDAYLAKESLFAVADGMGGHLAGEVASRAALKILEVEIKRTPPEKNQVKVLAEAIRQANRGVFERSQEKSSEAGMGTTITALLLEKKNNLAHFGHVGDSRAYLYRQEELRQLTKDHSLVAEMVEEGKISEREAQFHPQRSIITRALGSEANIEVDLQTITTKPGDRILLCTDGLSSLLFDREIKEILARELPPSEICKLLVEAANLKGGQDNITVIVIDVDSKKFRTPKKSSQEAEVTKGDVKGREERTSGGLLVAIPLIITSMVIILVILVILYLLLR